MIFLLPKERDRFHIYLLMGQSNMVGRDTEGILEQIVNDRIGALDKDKRWIVAREPMHVNGTGIGPGISFAAEMLIGEPMVKIGLVPCAVGRSPLQRWTKGGDLYEEALTRVKKALEHGTLKAVLWHQGEQDSLTSEEAGTYASRLEAMFRDLRNDVEDPRLPILVGQLGDFYHQGQAAVVKGALSQVTDVLERVVLVASAGLGHKGDGIHFDTPSQREFGGRYAMALKQLLARP